MSKSKKLVKVGHLTLGGGDVYIQSMLSRPADDIAGNIAQAKRLEAAGCDIIRAAVPEKRDARLIAALKEAVGAPIVADIHFDYKIALEAVGAGADKIRINPGNIGGADRIKAVADACRNAGASIRIGVNSGSLKKGKGAPTADMLVESALENVRLLEHYGFYDIVAAVKSSSVPVTIAAYRKLAELCPYPLHVGVTEAGTERAGLIKSAIGIGALLVDGIGDTLRVSLTAEPEREVEAAKDILLAAGIRKGVEIISCPTCGRAEIDVISLAKQVEEAVNGVNKPLKIAVMGCGVNGPGEAREADIGVAGGRGGSLLFKKGEIMGKIAEAEIIEVLIRETEKWQD